MTTEVTITLIIESAAVLIPSAITILTLLKKKFYKHTIDNITQKLDIMANSNEQNLKLIHNELNMHNKALMSFLQVKQAGQKIRQITKHALEITKDEMTCKLLTKFTEDFVIFVRQVLDIGFQNIGREQLLSKFELARDNTNIYGIAQLNEERYNQWLALIKGSVSKYKADILQIYSDKVNSKNNRFLVKSLDFAHTIVKQFVLYYAAFTEQAKEL